MTDLRCGWVLAKLGDIADWGSGGTPKSGTSEYYGGEIPWVVTGDLTDGPVRASAQTITQLGLAKSSAKLVPPGTVLVAMYGASIGRVGIASIPLATNQAIANAQVYSRVVLPEYVLYYILSQRRALAAAGKGAAQPNIGQGVLKEWPIPIAPLAEQSRIVAAIDEQFSRLDAGVAALEKVRQSLKRMRAAALSGLLRDEDGADFPQVALGDVLMRGRYGTSTKCSETGKGLPVLRIPNVQSGMISLLDLKFAIDLSVDLSGAQVTEGDILIIRTNGSRSLIGRAAVVPKIPYPVAFASYLIQLRMDTTTVNPAYVVAALAAPRLRARLEELAATTAGQYNISLDKLRSLSIPLPSVTQQIRALSMADHLLSIADRLDEEALQSISRANRLRASILTKAFSGGLVPQNSSDEPASVLLDRIAADRASFNGQKLVRPRKSLAPRGKVST